MQNKEIKKLTTCPNCQTTLAHQENFCPNCGQKNRSILLSVRDIFDDVIGSIFNYDARIWSSLRLLFFQPGQLTVNYLNGKRAAYLSPIRLYLSISVLYFLLLAFNYQKEIQIVDKEIAAMTQDDLSDSLQLNLGIYTINVTGEALGQFKNTKLNIDSFLLSNDIPVNTMNRLMLKQSIRALSGGMGNMANQFNRISSFSMFFLMPIFAFVLLGFFKKKRAFYLEHLVLSLHLHTLTFILFSIEELMELTLNWKLDENEWYTLFSFAVVFLFFILYVKRVYQFGWKRTIIKALGVAILYSIILIITLVLVGFVSLLLF